MFTIIDAIGDFFEMIGNLLNFLWDSITGTIKFIGMLPSLLSNLTLAGSYLPAIVLPFFTMSITVTVIYLIVGRSNNT